jgi:ubiquitin-conjugating enzyme E2 Q
MLSTSSCALRDAFRQMQAVQTVHSTCRPDECDGLSWTDELVLHLRFPPSFPMAPPFVRVVSPVFEMMTGHVVAGGAICTEFLTLSDGPGGWQPGITMISLLSSILHMMSEGGVGIVRGAGRYDERLAYEGYRRVATRYGWKVA